MNSYIIDSNEDCMTDDDGRRFLILDVSHSRRQDKSYFGPLKENCFNDEVGEAFYSMMIETDTTGFFPQGFPDTESKSIAFASRLNNMKRFSSSSMSCKSAEFNT